MQKYKKVVTHALAFAVKFAANIKNGQKNGCTDDSGTPFNNTS